MTITQIEEVLKIFKAVAERYLENSEKKGRKDYETTVWVLSEIENEDQYKCVLGVFSTEAIAQKTAKQHKIKKKYRLIESFAIDEGDPGSSIRKTPIRKTPK